MQLETILEKAVRRCQLIKYPLAIWGCGSYSLRKRYGRHYKFLDTRLAWFTAKCQPKEHAMYLRRVNRLLKTKPYA